MTRLRQVFVTSIRTAFRPGFTSLEMSQATGAPQRVRAYTPFTYTTATDSTTPRSSSVRPGTEATSNDAS